MARPRKPEKLRMLHGDKLDRFNFDEPLPGPDEPEVPAELSDAQRAVWDDVTRWLRTMGMLSATDAATIEAYVVITEKLTRMRVKMTAEPEIVRNPSNGMPMTNPIFGQWLKATSKMEQLSNKLGLNPSARSGIHAGAAQAGPPVSVDRLFGR